MYFVEAGTLVVLKQIEGDEKKVPRTISILVQTQTTKASKISPAWASQLVALVLAV